MPYEVIYDNLRTTNNGVDILKAKDFVEEVTKTVGWEDINEVRKVVDRYDQQFPDWSHDFPINGYMQMKKEGILFPAVWTFFRKLMYHSFHRMIMTSFNKINFPYMILIPYGKRKWEAQSLHKNFFNEGEYKYLNFHFDLDKKITEYKFSTEKLRSHVK